MTKVTCDCKACGKEFKIYEKRLSYGRGLYCSRKCQLTKARENIKGKTLHKNIQFKIYDTEELSKLNNLRTEYDCSMAEAVRMAITWGLNSL